MALQYKGLWLKNTNYFVNDYVTDENDKSGQGAGTLLYCIADHRSSSTNLTNDWDAGIYWTTRSGTNAFYNNNTSDGGPKLMEGTLATATEVEDKFTAVAKGFDQIELTSGASLTLSGGDYGQGGRNLPVLKAERANKVISFDPDGNVSISTLKGTYRGDWVIGATYLKDDTVKDATNVFGHGIDSLLVCILYHENASSGNGANWDVWIDTAQLAAAVAAAEASEDAAEISEWNSEASRRTSDNYAVTPEDTFVNVVSSDGDGTYTNTPTTDYSSLHWAKKSDGAIVTVINSLTSTSTTDALSAAQGKVLQDNKVDNSRVLTNVPAGAKFTDTNTQNTINNTLTSTSTTQSLSAAQGKSLQDNKLAKTAQAADSAKLGGVSASSYLRTTGKAADSNLLDGVDGSNYLRSNVSDTFTGTLTVTGAIVCSGNVTAYSDVRLKKDIEPIIDAIDKVKKLVGVTYTRKADGERGTGLIAQDLREVLPEAVVDDGMYLSVAYGNTVGLLVEAIKELSERVAYLEHKV